jgi:hypothetical protein
MSAFDLLLKSNGIIAVPEYKFHPKRKWRFDYAFPDIKVALEIEGGLFHKTRYMDKRTGQMKEVTGGRHTTGSGYLKDMEKYNTATLMGWKVLRCTPGQLLTAGLSMVLHCYGKHKPEIGHEKATAAPQ